LNALAPLAYSQPYAALKLKSGDKAVDKASIDAPAASGAGVSSSPHSKIFINICLLDDCDVMTLKPSKAKGEAGLELRVPTMLNQPTYVLDNKKQPTLCVDVCVSPKTMQMAGQRGQRLVKEVLGVCCSEAVAQLEKHMRVSSLKVDPRSFVVLQGTTYMGGGKKPAPINVFGRRKHRREVEARVAALKTKKALENDTSLHGSNASGPIESSKLAKGRNRKAALPASASKKGAMG